jgi:hypothetical protein
MGQGYGKVFGPLMSPEVKPLTELHISDIRKAHSVYINLEVQPGVSSPQFAQIFGCLRTADRTKVFKFFAKDSAHRRVDVNEILAVAILTATAFVSVKTRVLFQLYDLDDSMDLSLSETVMMLGSAVRGLSRCTDGAKPSAHEVELFCAELFKKIDMDADDRVTEEEWSSACARNPVVRACLAGRDKSAKFPTSQAPLSAVFHSFRRIFGRAIISRSGLDAWMLFPERARAEHSR